MAKDGDILDTNSEGNPITGVTGSPSSPGTVRHVLVNDSGRLQVDVITGGGGGGGGTSMTDDAAFTPGTTSVTPAAGTYRTVRDALDDNDAGAIALTQNRGQYVTLENSAATEVGTGANPIRIDPTGTTTQPVSVSSVVPGTGATNLGKAEDAAAANGDTGVVLLAQRHDALSTTVSANEDYSTIHVDNVGRLKTIDSTNADGTALTGIYYQGSGLTAEVVSSEPSPGQTGLVTYIIPNSSNAQLVSGSVSVSAVTPGTGATALGKAEDAVHASGDVGVMSLAVRNDATTPLAANGDYIPLAVDAFNGLKVDSIGIAGNPNFYSTIGAFDVPAMFLVDPITLSLPGVSDGGLQVSGNVAHDAVDIGNPHKIGGKASSTLPTAVASADRVNAFFDLNGRLQCKTALVDDSLNNIESATAAPAGTERGLITRNIPSGTQAVTVSSITAGTTRIGGTYDVGGTIIDEVPTARSINRAFVQASASGNTQIVAAQGGGVRIRVLAVFAVAAAAVSIKFQSATTDKTASFALAANGGFVLPETAHGWFETNANEALNVNLGGAVSTGVQIIWVQST